MAAIFTMQMFFAMTSTICGSTHSNFGAVTQMMFLRSTSVCVCEMRNARRIGNQKIRVTIVYDCGVTASWFVCVIVTTVQSCSCVSTVVSVCVYIIMMMRTQTR